MQPETPPTTTPQRTSFEDFKGALSQYNDSSAGVASRVGAYQASQVQPNFDYQQSLQTSNANLSALKKAANGEGFQKVPKADGGFDFVDPLGKKITVHQYAQATGTDPVKALADSNNSRDRQFVADYNHVQTLANALINNDKSSVDKIAIQLFGKDEGVTNKDAKKQQKARDDAKAYNEKVVEKFYQDLHDNYSNGDQLIKGFMQYYPEVYSDLSNVYAQPHPSNQLPNYNFPGV